MTNKTLSMQAKPELPDSNGWKSRHNTAVAHTDHARNQATTHEAAIIGLLTHWSNYAECHAREFDFLVGHDRVLGDDWEKIGDALRGLLNGITGPRLDCGTLDGFILETMKAHGVEVDCK